MNYRNVEDLANTIRNNVGYFRTFDLIVGIPRSGIPAASLAALMANTAFQSLPEFLAGGVPMNGFRLKAKRKISKVLVLDDSCNQGNEMNRVRAMCTRIEGDYKLEFAAVYCTETGKSSVDRYFEIVEYPRMFEWNILSHPLLAHALLDFDGVLCEDPSANLNDDGPLYREFVLTAKPLHIPASAIGGIVSARLNKYRDDCETWLKTHHIKYSKLHLLEGYTAEERRIKQPHAKFKAEIYAGDASKILFIESSAEQASEIFKLTQKPVFCIENNQMLDSKKRKFTSFERKLSKKNSLHSIRRTLGRVTRRILKS
ncbi:phosphoribosyltransferase [Nibricoccus sp. IMCC34717]|uniref:phosphoribosyltransferase n=1 Tax=Nibricoccus sp. IMCC34717 TaxID=3034021 RepID=UPI00384D56C0